MLLESGVVYHSSQSFISSFAGRVKSRQIYLRSLILRSINSGFCPFLSSWRWTEHTRKTGETLGERAPPTGRWGCNRYYKWGKWCKNVCVYKWNCLLWHLTWIHLTGPICVYVQRGFPGYSIAIHWWCWWCNSSLFSIKCSCLKRNYSTWQHTSQHPFYKLLGNIFSVSITDCICHPLTIIAFIWCWLVTVNVSGQDNIPWVSFQKCEVLSLAFLFFIFTAVEWMSHYVMAGFKYGPQQTAAAGYVWGNPDLSSSCFPGK